MCGEKKFIYDLESDADILEIKVSENDAHSLRSCLKSEHEVK